MDEERVTVNIPSELRNQAGGIRRGSALRDRSRAGYLGAESARSGEGAVWGETLRRCRPSYSRVRRLHTDAKFGAWLSTGKAHISELSFATVSDVSIDPSID